MSDDLISRQEAIDALNKRARDTFSLADGYQYYLGALHDVADDIKQLPSAQQEQRWIPCSERLPKYNDEMYLVTVYREQTNRRRIHISYCYANREGFWSGVPVGCKVIAWMPLPEPYAERSE